MCFNLPSALSAVYTHVQIVCIMHVFSM